MNISLNLNNNTVNHRKVSFSGQRLFQFNMKKKIRGSFTENVPVWFTKLTQEDVPLLTEILPLWQKYTDYGNSIIKSFLAEVSPKRKKQKSFWGCFEQEFYMIEKCNESNSKSRVKALARLKNYEDEYFISYLQSASKIPTGEKLKGAGELLLYGIIKRADDLNKEFVDLISLADDWYSKLGFKMVGDGNCLGDALLLKENYHKLMKYVESKYKVTG